MKHSANILQVDGIMRLTRLLQEVNEKAKPSTAASGPAALLPSQVSEAVKILQWFLEEAQTLPPSARFEALRWVP